jgi:ribonuclease VapC
MNPVVLDASALLAVLNQELGYKIVEEQLSNAIISAVNLSEVITILTQIGIELETAETLTAEIVSQIVPFDHVHAVTAAALRNLTKAQGLSLGDRACLALAKLKKLPVLTADKAWGRLELGINIQIIR